MISSVDRIVRSASLQSALILFAAMLACPSLSFAQGTATGVSGNPTAGVVGGCNIVQQNVAATGGAPIINELNCIPEKPEDSFLLHYVWLNARLSSYLVAGHFDPVLAQALPANPGVVRNPVFEKLQEIVTRFGRIDSLKPGPGVIRSAYRLIGSKSQLDVDAQWQKPSDFRKMLRVYAGEEKIILPDVPALQTVFKAHDWPRNYKMTYKEDIDEITGVYSDYAAALKNPESADEFQNAAISCVLLYKPISASVLQNYWGSMTELEKAIIKKSSGPSK